MIKILENIFNAVNDKKDIINYMPQLSDAIDQLEDAESDEYKEIHYSTGELLNSISSESNSILISLQVQDITSQKIVAVNYLLDSISEKICNMLMKFQPAKACSPVKKENSDRTSFISTLHRPIAFNPGDADIITPEDDRNFSHDDIEALFRTAT